MFKIIMFTALTGFIGFYSIQATQDDLEESIKRGEQVYLANCMSCHMMTGEGLAGVYPPLVGVDSLLKSDTVNIRIILKGQNGEVIVNGEKYNTDMPAQDYLTDDQIADVLNYTRNSWGNKGEMITPAQVKAEREKMNN